MLIYSVRLQTTVIYRIDSLVQLHLLSAALESSLSSAMQILFILSAGLFARCVVIAWRLSIIPYIFIIFARLTRLRKVPANVYTIHLAANNAILSVMSLRIGVKIFWDLEAEDGA